MSKFHIGFDIGTGALKIVQCDGAGVRRLALEKLPENLVKEGTIVSFEAMADFIREAAHKHRILGRDCAVVLPAEQVVLRRLQLPAMTTEQLAVNLPYEFRDYLTMGKDKYVYDYAVNDLCSNEYGEPVELDLTAAAVSKETIAAYENMFRRAGFKLRVAAPPECAYANLLRTYGMRNAEASGQDCCILDLGHAATRVHIFTGSRFEATCVIEYGSAMVDSAIADALGVDKYVARTYKETNHKGAQVLEGPKDIYNSIAVEMVKAIHFYGFKNPGSDLQHAYCCGGGVQIAPLMETIAGSVRLTMHSISALLPPVGRKVEDVDMAAFAAAVGITQQ